MNADIRERLRAALHQPSRPLPAARAESVTELSDLSKLGGRWFASADGPGYVIESVYDAGHEHGNVVLHRALTVDPARLAGQCRDERLAACPPSSFVYVDTETTGLGGAGSMVFLAGAARFEGSRLLLRQYLLPGPQFEGGLLGGLAGELESAGALVSYNGKSFDLPLLEARYILSRKRPTFRSLPHLDLLHPNRRLFRGTFASHRQPQMEVGLLGFEREDDCPSAEVPERYFRFQRTADPTHILPVLRHNAWDVLSLVALAAHLGGVCDGAEFPLQAARAAEYAGDLARAIGHYEEALARGLRRVERLEAMDHLARLHRRLGQFEEAGSAWRTLTSEPRARRITPFVELAKLLEHQLRDSAAALATTDEVLALVRSGLLPPGPAGTDASLPALLQRQARLAERNAKAAAKATQECDRFAARQGRVSHNDGRQRTVPTLVSDTRTPSS